MASNKTLIDLFRADDLITRYPGGRSSFNCTDGCAEFELDPAWYGNVPEVEYLDASLCGLIIAIWKDCEVRWYNKSRNRGLGANFTTECRSFDEWQKLAFQNIPMHCMTPTELKKILDKIAWPDNYSEVEEDDE